MKNNYLVVPLIFPLTLIFIGQISDVINCPSDELPCDNGWQCIQRQYWCDKGPDCGDGSDEKYCKLGSFLNSNPNACGETRHLRCAYGKCFPRSAFCDGTEDCKEGEDEFDCNPTDTNMSDYYSGEIESDFDSNDPVEKAVRWILSERLPNYGWGKNTPRAIVALALAEPERFTNGRQEENLMKKRLLLEIRQFVIRDDTGHPHYARRLASYINAMLATCEDPNHFENTDLVKTLRQQVKMRTSPSVYLTLCIANSTDVNDVRKILDVMNSKRARIWPELKALSILALHCITDKLKLREQYSSLENRFADLLKVQFPTPYEELMNVSSTALVKQALDAVYGTGKWQSGSLITYLLKDHQKADGSFGDLRSTAHAISALVGRSRLFLGSMPCPPEPKINKWS